MPQRISSPRLIGREPELARLQELYARAVSAAFTLALVKGDAGIGKSRLVRELEASDALADALTLRGSCFPIAGEEAPYGPLVAALRDVPAERLEAAAAGLAESVIAELALLLPALGRQAPAGRDGSRGAQGRQYEYLLELLARLADDTPVVLIVEDIHWADPSTLDFLSFVARNARSERVLLVATHRLPRRPRPAGARALHRPARALPGGRDDHARPAHRSPGQRADRRHPAAPGGRRRSPAASRPAHRATRSTSRSSSPTARRPRRRSRPGRPPRCSNASARSAPRPSTCCRCSPRSAARSSTTCWRKPSRSRSPSCRVMLRTAVDSHVIEADRAALTFRHALTREAVYDALLPGERRRLHAAVAGALAQHPDLTDAAELAVQWRAAGRPAAALAASLEAARAATGVLRLQRSGRALHAPRWRSGVAADAPDIDHAAMLLDAADAALPGRRGAACRSRRASSGCRRSARTPTRVAPRRSTSGSAGSRTATWTSRCPFYNEALLRLDDTASAGTRPPAQPTRA